ncbi:MAG: DUF4389 domain-containing protein [Gammaproteobacteria bacterium]|nr:DUF4389 domain-containing protein [Gammaproteobacteria bacterium]
MDEQIKERLTRRAVWVRALFMVFFAIAYAVAELVVWAVVVVQFFIVLFTGRANEKLLQFGNNLSAYVWRVFRYQTFNTESQPFPFDDWPEEKVGDNPWMEEPELAEDPPEEPAGEHKPDDG